MTLVEIAQEWKNGNRNLDEEVRNVEIYKVERVKSVLDEVDPGFNNPNSMFMAELVFDNEEEKEKFVEYIAEVKGIEYN